MTTKTIELPDMSGWTVESLDAALTAICEANPRAENPLVGCSAMCLYEDEEGRNCLIGYLLDICGTRVDSSGMAMAEWRRDAETMMRRLGFPRHVAMRAGQWQVRADRDAIGERQGWGALPAVMRSVIVETGSEEF